MRLTLIAPNDRNLNYFTLGTLVSELNAVVETF